MPRLFKTPTQTLTSEKCQLPGHAHCKQITYNLANKLVIGGMIHYVNGTRHIDNAPRSDNASNS